MWCHHLVYILFWSHTEVFYIEEDYSAYKGVNNIVICGGFFQCILALICLNFFPCNST